jgi:hypothetical protein
MIKPAKVLFAIALLAVSVSRQSRPRHPFLKQRRTFLTGVDAASDEIG